MEPYGKFFFPFAENRSWISVRSACALARGIVVCGDVPCLLGAHRKVVESESVFLRRAYGTPVLLEARQIILECNVGLSAECVDFIF